MWFLRILSRIGFKHEIRGCNMTYQETIGNSQFQPPALPRNLGSVIEEYESKFEQTEKHIAGYKSAIEAMELNCCVSGTYVENVVKSSFPPSAIEVKRNLLKSAWKHVYNVLNLNEIASISDKKSFEMALADPAPFTKENIVATFGDYVANPRFHILKGLAEVFCRLDPFYKSHSNMQIGVKGLPKRVIINKNYSSSNFNRDEVHNLVNAVAVVEGRTHVGYDIISQIENECRKAPYEYDGFTFKQYVNGNTHVHFSPNKLNLVNRALAEFYGDVLPDAPQETESKKASTEVSKDLQFYPTPKPVVHKVLNQVSFMDGDRVLEPSCGEGAIMDELVLLEQKITLIGVECDHGRASKAKAKGHSVITDNFLQTNPTGDFDKVVMNPPFYGKHYIKHVEHAAKFLKQAGTIACILPATARYNHNLLPSGGTWYDLPVASFKESGTNIPTGFYVWRKR